MARQIFWYASSAAVLLLAGLLAATLSSDPGSRPEPQSASARLAALSALEESHGMSADEGSGADDMDMSLFTEGDICLTDEALTGLAPGPRLRRINPALYAETFGSAAAASTRRPQPSAARTRPSTAKPKPQLTANGTAAKPSSAARPGHRTRPRLQLPGPAPTAPRYVTPEPHRRDVQLVKVSGSRPAGSDPEVHRDTFGTPIAQRKVLRVDR